MPPKQAPGYGIPQPPQQWRHHNPNTASYQPQPHPQSTFYSQAGPAIVNQQRAVKATPPASSLYNRLSALPGVPGSAPQLLAHNMLQPQVPVSSAHNNVSSVMPQTSTRTVRRTPLPPAREVIEISSDEEDERPQPRPQAKVMAQQRQLNMTSGSTTHAFTGLHSQTHGQQQPRPQSDSRLERHQSSSTPAPQAPVLQHQGLQNRAQRQEKIAKWGHDASVAPSVQDNAGSTASTVPTASSTKLTKRATPDWAISLNDAALSSKLVSTQRGAGKGKKGGRKTSTKASGQPSTPQSSTPAQRLSMRKPSADAGAPKQSPAATERAQGVASGSRSTLALPRQPADTLSAPPAVAPTTLTQAGDATRHLQTAPSFRTPCHPDPMLPQPALPCSNGPTLCRKTTALPVNVVPASSPNRKRRASADTTGDKYKPAKRTRIEDHAVPVHPTLAYDGPLATLPLEHSHIEASDDEAWSDEEDGEDLFTLMEKPFAHVDATSTDASASARAKATLLKGLSLSLSSSPPKSTDVDAGSAKSAYSDAASLVTAHDSGGDFLPIDRCDGSVESLFSPKPSALELEPLGVCGYQFCCIA